jgi:hypothetical protein
MILGWFGFRLLIVVTLGLLAMILSIKEVLTLELLTIVAMSELPDPPTLLVVVRPWPPRPPAVVGPDH